MLFLFFCYSGVKSENVELRDLLEKVKEAELEMAAEDAMAAASLWDNLEKECKEMQDEKDVIK